MALALLNHVPVLLAEIRAVRYSDKITRCFPKKPFTTIQINRHILYLSALKAIVEKKNKMSTPKGNANFSEFRIPPGSISKQPHC